MKKLFLMAATAAMFLSVSCMSETSVGPEGEATITVSVELPHSAPETRKAEAPGQIGQLGDLVNGYIYILDGDQIVYREVLTALTPDTEDQVTQIVGEGKGENGDNMLFPTTSRVYVLANIPGDITDPASFKSLDELSIAASAISYASGAERNTNYKEPALGNAGGTSVTVSVTADPTKANAVIDLVPLFTRVEVDGIKGGKLVDGFTLDGVWMDNYYSSFTLTGGFDAATLHDNNQDPLIADKAGWFGDAVTTNNTWATNGDPVTAGTNMVWAYHIAAGNVPRIVLKISALMQFLDNDEDGEPDGGAAVSNLNGKFVTVKRYTDTTGKMITAFERGKIYKIQTIVFNEAGLTPNIDDVEITAIVTVKDWEPVVAFPEFD